MKNAKISKKIIITIIIILLVVFLVTVTTAVRNSGKSSTFQSWIDDAVSYVDRVLSAPVRGIDAAVQSVNTMFSTFDENEQLKKKIDNYTSLETQNAAYREENKQLKAQLKMNETLTSYDTVTVSVINRSPDNWQNILIIDRGKKEGIKEGMPVMGSKGLIGRVIQANNSSSKVQLLTASTNNSSRYPVMIQNSKGSVYGLLNSYSSEDNAYVITQLTSRKNVKKGDRVITSGLGGESPKGLYVGTVLKVKKDSYGLNEEVYVKPAGSLYDISVVTVVKRLAQESGDD